MPWVTVTASSDLYPSSLQALRITNETKKVIAKFEQTEGVFEKLHKTINRTPFLSHLQKIKKTFVWSVQMWQVMAIASLFQIEV